MMTPCHGRAAKRTPMRWGALVVASLGCGRARPPAPPPVAAPSPVAAARPSVDPAPAVHPAPPAHVELGSRHWRVSDRVTGLAFTEDGAELVVATFRAGLYVLDPRTGHHQRHFPIADATVHGLALLSDGAAALVATSDGLRRHDLETGRWSVVPGSDARAFDEVDALGTHVLAMTESMPHVLLEVPGLTPGGSVGGAQRWVSAKLVPGRRWVAASRRDRVGIWDWTTGKREHQLPTAHDGKFAIAGDGSWIAVVEPSHGEWAAALWSLETGDRLHAIHGGELDMMTSTRDGERIIMAGDETIAAWDARSGAPVSRMSPAAFDVTAMAVSSDGALLAAGGDDHTAGVWEIDSGRRLSDNESHRGQIIDLQFSSDGSLLASHAYLDPEVRVWSSETGEHRLTARPPGELMGASFDPTGRTLYVVAKDGEWTFTGYDLETSDVVARWTVDDADAWDIHGQFDGTLAVVGNDRVSLFSGTGEPVWSSETLGSPGQSRDGAAAFTPEGGAAVVYSTEGWLVLDLVRRRSIARRELDCRKILSAAVAAGGDVVVTSDLSHSVAIWRASTLAATLDAGGFPEGLAVAPRGDLVAYTTRGALGLWRPEPSAHRRRDDASASDVAFSPAGDRLAIGRYDGTVSIEDVPTLFDALAPAPVVPGPPLEERCDHNADRGGLPTGVVGGVVGIGFGDEPPDLREGMFAP